MISAPNLSHIQYTQLNHGTWCATAQVSDSSLSIGINDLWNNSYWLSISNISSKKHIVFSMFDWGPYQAQTPPSPPNLARRQRQLQRQGVRQLLQQLLDTLEINDVLDESSFPYRLIDSQYYVCFSHTNAHNNKNIKKSVSRKTEDIPYSKIAVVISRHRPVGIDIENNNVAWHVAKRFYSDHEMDILQTLPISQRDYAIKLLWQIKESFIKVHQYTLAQGLGMDYSDLIPSLTDSMNKNLLSIQRTSHHSNYQIAILQLSQTVVVF